MGKGPFSADVWGSQHPGHTVKNHSDTARALLPKEECRPILRLQTL